MRPGRNGCRPFPQHARAHGVCACEQRDERACVLGRCGRRELCRPCADILDRAERVAHVERVEGGLLCVGEGREGCVRGGEYQRKKRVRKSQSKTRLHWSVDGGGGVRTLNTQSFKHSPYVPDVEGAGYASGRGVSGRSACALRRRAPNHALTRVASKSSFVSPSMRRTRNARSVRCAAVGRVLTSLKKSVGVA
jgi:hypothetical protein